MSVDQEVIVVQAGQRERNYWRDLWRYRELLYFLARRDISVRYKQAVLGVAWAVIRPVVAMVIFTLIFGRIAKLPSQGVPYSLLVFAGMVPWFFFSAALNEGSGSLLSNANLMTKVYFPRLLVPLSAMAVATIDFLISLLVLLIYMAWVGYAPNYRVFALPVFFIMALLPALGMALWFAALNVKYRDFQFVVPFLLQLGLYISPVGFDSHVIPDKWRSIYALNPVVSVIDGFRWSLLGEPFKLNGESLMISLGVGMLLLLVGLTYFRHTERALADVI